MLVLHIRHVQTQEGVRDFLTAVTRGAAERLMPILMTALAAGFALVLIAMSLGEAGSEIQAPMALVILFGLASPTALNMIVVPVLYAHFGLAFDRRSITPRCVAPPLNVATIFAVVAPCDPAHHRSRCSP